ncbi:MAG: hypothetical protein AAFO07_08430 [Bacteroidota bacterium]
MIETKTKRKYRFSAVMGEHYKEVVFEYIPYEDLFNEQINLSNYTNLVSQVDYIPIIRDNTEREGEFFEYNEETKEVFIQKIIDPSSDAHAILEGLFVSLIDLFPEEEWVEQLVADMRTVVQAEEEE